MRMLIINVDNTTKTIEIGRRAENDATQVNFDISELISTYGEGTATLMIKRPVIDPMHPDGDRAYPVVVTQSGNTVSWIASSTDTAYAGNGLAEIFWYVGDTLAKSILYTLVILPDIGANTSTAPDPYENWVDTLTALGTTVEDYARQARESAASAAAAAVEQMPAWVAPVDLHVFPAVVNDLVVNTGSNTRNITITHNRFVSMGSNRSGTTFRSVILSAATPRVTTNLSAAGTAINATDFQTITCADDNANLYLEIDRYGEWIGTEASVAQFWIMSHNADGAIFWRATSLTAAGYAHNRYLLDTAILANGNISVAVVFRSPKDTQEAIFKIIPTTMELPTDGSITLAASGKTVTA